MSIELRDRFFALSAHRDPDPEEVARYLAEVDATDTEPTTTVDGLAVCWHPTARHKAVRFVEAWRIDADVRDLFARPSEEAPHLAAVFADPRELSFRTFENIIPLDGLFDGAAMAFELSDRVELAPGAFSFAIRLPEGDRALLERLDALDLYVPPLNAASRGGDRFIFHSALLADALTQAVAKAMPESLMDGFSHVNPVFRCNRFEPGDANFHRHRDTPYYDAARRQVSRYTVLLYLTGGSADPALDLSGAAALTEIGPFTCVIFDQQYEHEGAPYRDGRKVFLRTELIFTDAEVTHDPEIGALFSKACYLTGESIFAPELARYADASYNRVAAAHWEGLTSGGGREPFVHKRFRGVDFVANGYDFWFPKSEGLTLPECAAITLLDYFNCKLGDTPFRALCESTVIEAEGTGWIPGFLQEHRREGGDPAVPAFDKSMLFPEPEEDDDIYIRCCPFHSTWYDPRRHDEINDLYRRAQTFAAAHITPAAILMMGEDVVLDPDRFVIRGNQIHVLGGRSLTPVNFAACWNNESRPDNYLEVAATVGVADFLVPPILFTETDTVYHLRFDFFRNTWTVEHRQADVPIPMITGMSLWEMEAEGYDEAPWLSAVARSLVKGASEKHSKKVWWGWDDPLIDELYGYVIDNGFEYDEDEDEDDYEDEDD